MVRRYTKVEKAKSKTERWLAHHDVNQPFPRFSFALFILPVYYRLIENVLAKFRDNFGHQAALDR